MHTTAAPGRPTGRTEHPQRTRRPGRGRARKVLLLLHLVFAGAWLGMHVVLGVLVCTLFVSDDPRVISVSYRALVLFAIWPLLSVALLCLLSGLALGMVTKYGVLRYRWVVVKLALNVVLAVLIAFALPGGLEAAALAGQRIAEGAAVGDPPLDLLFPPIVSTAALLAAFVLSVFKPWGRSR
ncbi:MAG TPA: hypothetical protein VGM60_02375 [Pseudonocardia sp.]